MLINFDYKTGLTIRVLKNNNYIKMSYVKKQNFMYSVFKSTLF